MNAERVDITGQVLRKGESRRKDGRYHFAYTQLNGKRCYIYASNLDELGHKDNLYYFTKPGDSAYYDENVTLNTM